MKQKHFKYKNKTHTAFSKTQLCRSLGLLPNTRNLKDIIKLDKVKHKKNKKKYHSCNEKSPYKLINMKVNTVMGRPEKRRVIINVDLPTRKEIDSCLMEAFREDKYYPF